MKKTYLIFVLGIYLLSSCGNIQEQQKTVETIQFSQLETFLLDFLKRNPDGMNNEAMIKRTSKVLKKEFISEPRTNDTLLYSIPLELSNTFGESRVFGTFRSWGKKIDEEGLEDYDKKSIYLDVIVELNDQQIRTLKQGKKYLIKCDLIRYIKENDTQFIGSSYTFDPVMEKNTLIDNNGPVEFKLGTLYVRSKDIKEYVYVSKRKQRTEL